MPTIKETISVIENTPIDQAICLKGIHGIGKSECIVEYYKNKGYRCVVLFLGQMADAGDVVGMPAITTDDAGNEYTTFHPPYWWPKDPKEKVLIFLDELGREKPEVRQCVMDLVLNRKLNGRVLPENTKIVSAMNPNEDDFYDVEDLDPAFADRWNTYVFEPSVHEWLQWATKNKVHRYVIGFITKKTTYLDPVTSLEKNAKTNDIGPSRRSWKRVSDILNTGMDKNTQLLGTMCLGIIGAQATASFIQYVKAAGKGLHAGKILTAEKQQWPAVEAELITLPMQNIVSLNREVAQWFKEHTKEIIAGKKVAATSTSNVQKYLEAIPAEGMAEFFDHVSEANQVKEQWPSAVMEANPNMANKFFEIMTGKKKSRKSQDVDPDFE